MNADAAQAPDDQPTPNRPVAGQPVADQAGSVPLVADQAGWNRPVADPPSSVPPAAGQPVADQAGWNRPVAGQPVADQAGSAQAEQRPWPAALPLNRPVRWLIAAAEVVAAVALVVFAVWAWRRASIPMQLPESDNPAVPEFTSRLSGPWVAAAVIAATVAGLLLLDALREAVLAARARERRPSARDAGEARGEDVESPH